MIKMMKKWMKATRECNFVTCMNIEWSDGGGGVHQSYISETKHNPLHTWYLKNKA